VRVGRCRGSIARSFPRRFLMSVGEAGRESARCLGAELERRNGGGKREKGKKRARPGGEWAGCRGF
jgi:hypothetical protein